MMQHNCKQCAQPFIARARNQFCSIVCIGESRRLPSVQHACEMCGGPFTRPRTKVARFCSVACTNAARRAPVYSCERCGKSPLGKGATRFCSHACANVAQTIAREKLCGQCGKSFQLRTTAQKYCSPACSHIASKVQCICQQCGGETERAERKFCVACRAANNVRPDRHCLQCGGSISGADKRAKFCSQACAADVRRVSPSACLHCGNPTKHRKNKFCGMACFNLARHPPAVCVVCNGPRRPIKRRLTCSPECSDTWKRRIQNADFTPERIATIKQMVSDGATRLDIAEHVGLTFKQVCGIIARKRFYELRPTQQRTPAKPAERKYVAPRSGYAPSKPRPNVPKVSGGPRPITLTDLFRIGGQLYADGLIKRDDRHKVDAVSRVVRRDDPSHPGYRVVSPQYFTRRAA